MGARMASARTQLTAGLTLFLVAVTAVPGWTKGDYKAEKQRYEAYLERPSLWMRHRGRKYFADTKDMRALAILAKSYARPEAPKDHVKYLLASACADRFTSPPHVRGFEAWRKKHKKAQDAWLWYRTLAVDWRNDGPDALLDTARSRHDFFIRLAAVEQLAARRDELVIPLIIELMGSPPSRPLDRALLVETAAQVLYLERGKRTTKPWTDLAELVIATLDDSKTPARTRLTIARRLAFAFKTPHRYLDGDPWREHLKAQKPKVFVNTDPNRPRGAHFLGIRGTGSRVVYLVDMSDSMLTPLTAKELAALREAPKTETKDDKASGEAGIADLPWRRIRTRFDAAREFLKLSLRQLEPEQHFCVIVFGSQADLLKATACLKPAKEKHVEKAIAEIDTIVAGPKKANRPYGTLRGYTNVHGALHRAFKVHDAGLAKAFEYVDPKAIERGCDTIFLLSDGDPTWDDWPARDLLEAEDDSGDPESRGKTERGKTGHFYGPYAVKSAITDDLTRLNLFRKVEIHCIGIGEANIRFLKQIAHNGLGQVRILPEPKKKPAVKVKKTKR